MDQRQIEEAQETYSRIEAAALFDKLAEYGFVPQTEEEANQLYTLGQEVAQKIADDLSAEQTYEGRQIKIASYQAGLIDKYEGPSQESYNAAQSLFESPQIKEACAILAIAEAEALSQNEQ